MSDLQVRRRSWIRRTTILASLATTLTFTGCAAQSDDHSANLGRISAEYSAASAHDSTENRRTCFGKAGPETSTRDFLSRYEKEHPDQILQIVSCSKETENRVRNKEIEPIGETSEHEIIVAMRGVSLSNQLNPLGQIFRPLM